MGVLLLTPASYCLDGMKIRGNVRLKIHSLEALGVAVIPVSRYGFMRLLDHEKIPYLANKINSRTFAPNLSFQVSIDFNHKLMLVFRLRSTVFIVPILLCFYFRMKL